MARTEGRLLVWPARLDPWLTGLRDRLEEVFDSVTDSDLDTLGGTDSESTLLLVIPRDQAKASEALSWLENLGSETSLNLIVIADDSYLGTDSNRSQALRSGSAVAAVRSLAVERETRVRANVICLPESLEGAQTELRGPLPQQPEIEDVVEAISFFAGPDAGYLSGQVLYVNSGRQLFSSHTS